MATNKKITELTALTSADDTDVFPIVDISELETKKITKANLGLARLAANETITGGWVFKTAPTSGNVIATTLYNPHSGGGSAAAGLAFANDNSSAAMTTYAAIYGRVNANTAGAEKGILDFQTVISGTLASRMLIDQFGNVGIGTTPNANAILDVSSTTKAFMPPRMTTTQRDAIASPTEGMVIFNITTHVLNFYYTSWAAV